MRPLMRVDLAGKPKGFSMYCLLAKNVNGRARNEIKNMIESTRSSQSYRFLTRTIMKVSILAGVAAVVTSA